MSLICSRIQSWILITLSCHESFILNNLSYFFSLLSSFMTLTHLKRIGQLYPFYRPIKSLLFGFVCLFFMIRLRVYIVSWLFFFGHLLNSFFASSFLLVSSSHRICSYPFEVYRFICIFTPTQNSF